MPAITIPNSATIRCIDSFLGVEENLFHKYADKNTKLGYNAKREDGVRMIFDENTGLFWEVKSDNQKDANHCKDTYCFSDACNLYTKKLNDIHYGGFDDWRMPNKDELRSILDYSLGEIAVHLDVFENCQAGDYWTNNTYEMQPHFGWVIFFGFGSGIVKSKETKRYVIACRGGKNPLFGQADAKRFKDNGNGTITDTATNVMWQKDENLRMDYANAVKHCEQLTLAGYNDWRMPNIKELNTTLNLAYDNSWWYFKDVFPAEGLNPPLLHYFSSTSFKDKYAWVTNFCFGYDGYYGRKNAPLLFRACRNADEKIAPAFTYKLPHTGQTNTYNTDGVLVTDKSLDGLDATRQKNPPAYTVIRNGHAVRDENTGLVWAINETSRTYNRAEAHEYIDSLNAQQHLGYNDWRMPLREELRSIVLYDDSIPAVTLSVFHDTKAEFYWAKEQHKHDLDMYWGIYFGYGCAIAYPKATKACVRAVRGASSFSGENERLKDNGDGTVSDLKHNIMWAQQETPLLTLTQALLYCKALRLAGHADWVMPNIKELGTLVNLDPNENNWFYTTLFPHTNTKPQGFYMASTTYDATFGWGCNFQFGFDGYYADRKNGTYPFRPMRYIF